MNIITKNIANILTSINLFSGCVGLFLVFQENYLGAFYAMLISAVADFFDGFAARLFKADQGIGKDLDSLADVVTFGVLPGFFMFHYMQGENFELFGFEAKWIALLIPVFSAWRLAIFNNDTRQTTGFIGLPTPANALIIASFVIWAIEDAYCFSFPEALNNVYFISAFILLTCCMLVSSIPLIALKFKGFSWKKDYLKMVLVLWILCLSIVLTFAAALPALISYVVISIIYHTYFETQR